MSAIVNVEGLDFEELIPLLLETDTVQDEIEYYVEDGHEEFPKNYILDILENQFNGLKNGYAVCDDLNETMIQCLDRLDRVLVNDIDDMCSISTKRLFEFLYRMMKEDYLDIMIEEGSNIT